MEILKSVLNELAGYEDAARALSKGESVAFSGCSESQKMHLFGGLSENFKRKIIITYDELKAKSILEDGALLDGEVCFFPAKDLIFYQADVFGNKTASERMQVLRKILTSEQLTVVTTVDALATPMIPSGVQRSNLLEIKIRSIVELDALAIKLVRMGYVRTDNVEQRGEFSIRGGIVDIYDLTLDNPVRIELWGDEVDSIRYFDVSTQRSLEKVREVILFPAREVFADGDTLDEGIKRIKKEAAKQEEIFRKAFKTEEAHRVSKELDAFLEDVEISQGNCNLESYIKYFYPEAESLLNLFDPEETLILLDEPNKIDSRQKAVEAEFGEAMSHRLELGLSLPGQSNILTARKKVYAAVEQFPFMSVSMMDYARSPFTIKQNFTVRTLGVASYNGSVTDIMRDLGEYKKKGYRVLVVSGSRTRAERLASNISDEGVPARFSATGGGTIEPGEVVTFYGRLNQGFEYPDIKFVVLSDTDIFGREKKKRKKKKYTGGQAIHDLSELTVGDYVVHESYGVGVYRGIEKITSDMVTKDYMKIEYAGDSNLYVPVSSFDMLRKYASAQARKPKINKLGTQEWNKTKTKVREAVDGVAKELVDLYAKRGNMRGFTYSKDTVWQKEFEELFPYDETEDQLAAIEATKNDMESGKIMDRLICGDVGYGKTEIAIRAAFKAVMEGKQVLFLVPTTILAQQHYSTFVQRMKDYPVKIDMLCRFKTAGEQKKTIENLKKGLVDIVIGTHRLLSKDVEPKDLGLLIIDEEQRFGVTHKEKIKHLRNDVDVLTLTATPIPRTLHMSLVGIRDMSLLEVAPRDRMPIQTFVMEYNDEMVREAVVREIARGGQVYFVYNRVNNIDEVAANISQLCPEANVAFAHGQMNEKELEDIMIDFVRGDTDVLVSTTIIETGLDIPNVNTIIIADSDRLGMSQLYQLRGRVGRSNRSAYAFLMYKKDKILKEDAEKRLAAIREFTDLGSGFKISMRDLEIRGAGNVLGMKQHGHMEAVGYELYCKMLNEAVGKLKGEEVHEDFETLMELAVDAYIPSEYIVNEVQKLEMYQKIASIEGLNDCEEMREELTDRFGSVPKSAENLLKIACLKASAARKYITTVKGVPGRITFNFRNDAPVKVEAIEDFISNYPDKIKFIKSGEPGFEISYETNGLVEVDEQLLLEKTDAFLSLSDSLFD